MMDDTAGPKGGLNPDNVIDFTKWKAIKQGTNMPSLAGVSITSNIQWVAGIIYLFDEEGKFHTFHDEATASDFAIVGAHALLQAQFLMQEGMEESDDE